MDTTERLSLSMVKLLKKKKESTFFSFGYLLPFSSPNPPNTLKPNSAPIPSVQPPLPSAVDLTLLCTHSHLGFSANYLHSGFPGGTSGKEPTCRCRRHKKLRFDPWVGKIPCSRKRKHALVLLPGESHGQRSLVGHSPRGRKESDMTK